MHHNSITRGLAVGVSGLDGDMKVKYKTTKWDVEIQPVEIERETIASVWIKGSRSSKHSEYARFWDTWEEAHTHLLNKAKRQVESLRLQLERAKGELGNIKGMRAP